jgi:nicotinamide mononucleotide (NMN) deamidase PncC
LINLEETVVRKLKTAQYILCTVESCSGGLISNLVTNVSGASEVYWGSWVSYDNSAKEELGVSSQLIASQGAVSAEVARALAECGLRKLVECMEKHPPQNSHALLKPKGFVCISTTGIAGPNGGTPNKPVGMCFIGLAISGRETIVTEFHSPSGTERVQNKLQFAQKALEMMRINI